MSQSTVSSKGRKRKSLVRRIRKILNNLSLRGLWLKLRLKFANRFVHPRRLSLYYVCEILGLPKPDRPDEYYTTLNYAQDTRKGGIALISDITSNPDYRTPAARQRRLAELAMEKGAKLLIATQPMGDYPTLVVEDVFRAYLAVIKALRCRFRPKTVCITGSIGKTTTTEMVHTVLRGSFRTHHNTGSANSVRYCGSVVQQLKRSHEMYVQETMEGPPFGAAATISKMVLPDCAVVTVVGTSHMESFGSQERILDSCLGIQEGLSENGLLILNADDPLQYQAGNKCKRRYVFYGIENEKADYRAVDIHGEGDGLVFNVLHDGRSTPVKIYCFGRYNVLDALAAFAVGKWAGMTDSRVAARLGRFRTKGIRQNLVSYGGYRLFLDCYNSAVESVGSAMDALSTIEVPESGRRIGVLADVLESGSSNEMLYHRSIGEIAADSCLDMLICYGKNAAYIAEVAREKGKFPVCHTEDEAELVALLREHVTRKDVTLFKGSHGMELERIVDNIWGTWFHEEFEINDFKIREISDEDFKYRVFTDHATVSKKLSRKAEVILPAYVEGQPVTGIEQNTFNSTKYTESVTFPETLVNIRYCAFYKAQNIRQISLPASLRIISQSAFNSCKSLETVSIAEGCTHIGYHAFYGCSQLRTVEIPSTVGCIGREAFEKCDNLTIYGKTGSYAERYAEEQNIPFQAMA